MDTLQNIKWHDSIWIIQIEYFVNNRWQVVVGEIVAVSPFNKILSYLGQDTELVCIVVVKVKRLLETKAWFVEKWLQLEFNVSVLRTVSRKKVVSWNEMKQLEVEASKVFNWISKPKLSTRKHIQNCPLETKQSEKEVEECRCSTCRYILEMVVW